MVNGKMVRLRPFEKSDLEQCRKLINDPDISRSVLRALPVSMHEHIQWYERIITDNCRVTLAIETIENKAYIGNIGLMNIDWTNRKGKLWLYLAKEAWNKGCGKEATALLVEYSFNNLNLNRIYLDVGVFNKKAINLYQALGFKQDGCLREEFYLDGSYVDVLRMSLLKREAFSH